MAPQGGLEVRVGLACLKEVGRRAVECEMPDKAGVMADPHYLLSLNHLADTPLGVSMKNLPERFDWEGKSQPEDRQL